MQSQLYQSGWTFLFDFLRMRDDVDDKPISSFLYCVYILLLQVRLSNGEKIGISVLERDLEL